MVGTLLHARIIAVFAGRGSNAPGSGSFGVELGVPAGDVEGRVEVADVDVDGIPDLLAAAPSPARLFVLRARRVGALWDGGFDSTVLPLLDNPVALSTGDFNGDGAVDAAVLTNTAVEVFLGVQSGGTGTGELVPTGVPIPLTTFGSALVSGPLNPDGLIDLVVAEDAPGLVTPYLSGGDGTFVPTTPVSLWASHLQLADLNGDRIADLVTDAAGDKILLGVGDGTFSLVPATDLGVGVEPSAVADFNADGILDVAIKNGSQFVHVLPGNGDGTFATAGPANEFGLYGFGIPLIADVNLDGVPDVTDFQTSLDEVRFATGATVDGLGTGTLTPQVGVVVGPGTATLIGTGDLTGDGVGDLLLSNPSLGELVFRVGQLQDARARWTRSIETALVPFTSFGYTGAATTPGVDRLGLPHATGVLTVQPIAATEDLAQAVALAGLLPGPPVTLTHPVRIVGDVKLTRVRLPDATGGPRLRVDCRLGPTTTATGQREGLGLGSAAPPPCRPALLATPPTDRAVVIELAAIGGRGVMDPAPTDVRVFRRHVDWVRADAVAADPFSTDPAAADHLPRIPIAGTNPQEYRDAIIPRFAWTEIPSGNFNTGTGERFRLNDKGARIEIMVDRLGDFQAFWTP